MSLLYFEGFDRANEFNPANWSFALGPPGDNNALVRWGVDFFRNSQCLYFLTPPLVSFAYVDLAAPLPHAQYLTDAVTLGAVNLNVGFAVSVLESKPATSGYAANHYFDILQEDGSVGCSVDISADATTNRLLVRFRKNTTPIATFYLTDAVGSFSETNVNIAPQDTGTYRRLATTARNSNVPYFEFVFSGDPSDPANKAITDVAVYVNGLQLLTSNGNPTATISLPEFAGWRFHGISRVSVAINDFYISRGISRYGYNTRVLSPLPSMTGYVNNWDNASPGVIQTADGDNSIMSTSVDNAVATFYFPPNLFGAQNVAVRGVKFVATARVDGSGVPQTIQPVYANADGSSIVPLASPWQLAGYYQRYYTENLTQRPTVSPPGTTDWQLTDFDNFGFGVKYAP